MPAKRIWLIRHGLTKWNMQKRWQGHVPTSLNEEGHRQAQLLGEYLKDEPITTIYTSDLPRAYQTAEPLASHLGLDLIPDKRLREVDVGIFQGLFPEEVDEYYPQEISNWHSDFDYAVPNGESRGELQIRSCKAFDDISIRHDDENVAIVTHGGTIRVMLQKLCSVDPEAQGRLPIPNTSFTVLEPDHDNWKIIEFLETPHLVNLQSE